MMKLRPRHGRGARLPRWCCARPTCSAAARWRSSAMSRASAATSAKRVHVSGKAPLLLDRYLSDAIEVDVDAVCDGEDVWMSPASWSISRKRACTRATAPVRCRPLAHRPDASASCVARPKALAKAIGVKGLMNVQYAVKDNDGLPPRGQPARLAHRAVRGEGHRRAGGQDRRAVMAGAKLSEFRDPRHAQLAISR
jgi:carbamoyl-phosphate synthase large subunit